MNLKRLCIALLATIPLTLLCPPIKKIEKRTAKKTYTLSGEGRLVDFFKGALILGAYGDAQARITEFWTNPKTLHNQRPSEPQHQNHPAIPPLKSIRTSATYARFTDDTHMSLYLMQSLLETYQQPIETILNSMTQGIINWLHADQQERAPGNACITNATTLQQLRNNSIGIQLWSRGLISSLDYQVLQQQLFNKEGGSGAVMRVAPISFMYYRNPEFAEQLSVVQGILTHTDSGSRAACAGFNSAMYGIIEHEGMKPSDIFDLAIRTAHKYDNRSYSQPYNPQLYAYGASHFSKNGCAAMCQKAKEYYLAGFDHKPYHEVLDEFRGWGATEALAAALYIFATWHDDPYIAMSIAISRTPGDSDTIAKMVGELIGARYGYDQIVQNFAQHGLNLEHELQYLENIHNLPEYKQHFTYFKHNNIRTFHDLAHAIAHKVIKS